MVHYNLLEIVRVIMHRILPKNGIESHVSVDANNSLVTLDNEIKHLISKRMIDSCGRQGKAFELSIEKDDVNSCFHKINTLNQQNDEDFINSSVEIAQLLADAQDSRIHIPGGYFLLVQARDTHTHNNVYIILKAEKQDALSDIGNSVHAIQNIFLSPSLKMYKAGVFEQINNNELTKDSFKVYLFDSQFNSGVKLAEYFYRDFLGFTIDNNAKVQSKLFYDSMNDMLSNVYKNDYETRNLCKEQLQAEFTNQIPNINPHEIINRIIPLEDRDVFISKLGGKFTNPFVKDTSLLNNKLTHRSIALTELIKLSAPSEMLSNNDIEISVDPFDPNVKIIKIRTHESPN